MQLLLERLAGAGDARFDMRQAVQQQVQRLVSIHVWEGDTGLHLMDMAIAPVADLHGGADAARFAARLHELIRRHEPRLQVLRVDLEPTGDTLAPLRLVVAGRLRGEKEPETLRFDLPRR